MYTTKSQAYLKSYCLIECQPWGLDPISNSAQKAEIIIKKPFLDFAIKSCWFESVNVLKTKVNYKQVFSIKRIIFYF